MSTAEPCASPGTAPNRYQPTSSPLRGISASPRAVTPVGNAMASVPIAGTRSLRGGAGAAESRLARPRSLVGGFARGCAAPGVWEAGALKPTTGSAGFGCETSTAEAPTAVTAATARTVTAVTVEREAPMSARCYRRAATRRRVAAEPTRTDPARAATSHPLDDPVV